MGAGSQPQAFGGQDGVRTNVRLKHKAYGNAQETHFESYRAIHLVELNREKMSL
jgi:hypothetical protein